MALDQNTHALWLYRRSQYGFRSKYSYSMAVSNYAVFSSEIIKSIDDKKITCSVFLTLPRHLIPLIKKFCKKN